VGISVYSHPPREINCLRRGEFEASTNITARF